MTKVVVELYGPGMSTPYVLYNGGKTGTAVVAKYNDGDALVSGDMNKDWLNKNIKGNWSITVKDIAAIQVPPGTPPFTYDGKFNWGINIQTLSSKKIQIKGNLIVDTDVTIGGKLSVAGVPVNGIGFTYRYNIMNMLDNSWSWQMGNSTDYALGVNPSNWSSNYQASHISADKDLWRMALSLGGRNQYGGVLMSGYYVMYPDSNVSRFAFFRFRIKSSSASTVDWKPTFYYSSFASWSDRSSAALNGSNIWNSAGQDCGAGNCSASPTFSIPANRTSTIFFVISGGSGWNPNGEYHRALFLAFAKGSLKLPSGLEFIDDLDTATGGYEK